MKINVIFNPYWIFATYCQHCPRGRGGLRLERWRWSGRGCDAK